MNIKSPSKIVGYTATIIIFLSLISLSLIEPELNLPPEKKGYYPDFSFEDVIVTQIDNGVTKWEMKSKSATIDKSINLSILKDATGIFFENDREVAIIQSPRSEINLKTSDMTFSDALVTFNIQDRLIHLKSKELYWYDSKQQFVGNNFIEINSGALSLSGETFTVDVPIQKLIISKNTKAEITKDIVNE